MISRQIVHGVLWSGAILVTALGLKWAQHNHLVSGDFVERAVEVVIGLGLAVYSNFIPKTVPGLKLSPARAARFQAAARLNAWIFVLAGIGFAAIWAFAPLSLAGTASMAVMGGGVVVVLVNLAICIISPKSASPAH